MKIINGKLYGLPVSDIEKWLSGNGEWRLVPVTPTVKMLDSGADEFCDPRFLPYVWEIMLSAAPKFGAKNDPR